MKHTNIRCPYCGAKALLRPASVVRRAAPGEKVYVCARYPACDAYVSAHRESSLPMGTLADCSLREKRRQVLDYGRRTYGGVAKLGIEAMELKLRGYTGADIAKLYGVKPNHVGAWISRAAAKLKKDGVLVENSAA